MNPFKAITTIAIRLKDRGLAGFFSNNTDDTPTMLNEFGVEVPIPPGYENPIESRIATSIPGIHYLGDIEESIDPNIPGVLQRETFRQVAIDYYMEEGMPPEEAGSLAAIRLQERFGPLSEHQRMRDLYLARTREQPTTNLNSYSNLSNRATRSHPPLYHNDLSRIQPMPTMPPSQLGYLSAVAHSPCDGCCHEATINCDSCSRAVRHTVDRPVGVPPIIDRFVSQSNLDELYSKWKEQELVKLREEARQEILDEMREERKVIKKRILKRVI